MFAAAGRRPPSCSTSWTADGTPGAIAPKGDINPQVRGWVNYCAAFDSSELSYLRRRLNKHLNHWAMRKSKRMKDK